MKALKMTVTSSLVLVFMAAALGGQSPREQYEKSLNKWRQAQMTSYSIKVEYRAFSPLRGIWELEVVSGTVTSFSHNGSRDTKFADAARRFTMESLYDLAAEKSGDGNSPFVMQTKYDRKNGFIKQVTKTKKPGIRGTHPKDTGFRIHVIEVRKK